MVQNKDLDAATQTFLYNLVDCKTVGFFHKISKEIGKAWRKSLKGEAREPHMPVGRVRREKKKNVLASLRSLTLRFQPRSRPFCLTARVYLNTQKYGLF